VAILLAAPSCSPQCGTAVKPSTSPVAAIPSPSPAPTAPLQTSSAPFHGGEVGVAYAAVALSATGGRAPYAWSVSTGALPGGLTLGPDGSVSGNPTAAGTFSFTIQVADAGTSTAGLPGTISIAAPLVASLIPSCAQYCRVELGCVTVCGGFGQVSGGVGPYAYALTQGPLPAGTSLSGLRLSGTFTGSSGYLKFTVQVSDAMGASTSVAPTFWMYGHISLAGGTCTGRGGCSVGLAYTGGTPGPLPTVSPTAWTGALKCGTVAVVACPQPAFSAGYQPGVVTITLVFQPNSPATFGTMTLTITDNSLCAANTWCTATATLNVVG